MTQRLLIRAVVATALSLGTRGRIDGQMMMNAGGTRPAPSPDGRYVAFSAARNGLWDVYAINVDGKEERRVTEFGERTFTNLGPPTWIGGQILVFHRMNDTTRAALFDAQGQPPVKRRTLGVPSDSRQVRPSPDGRYLVLVHGDGRQPRLAVSRVDGSELRDIANRMHGALQPAWSPDGKQLAVSLLDSAGAGELATIGVDGSSMRILARFSVDDGAPLWASWSPDGSRIAVQAGHYYPARIEESTAHIWLVDVATGRSTKLAPHSTAYLDETPAWLPDGSRIAFQSNRTGILQVWTMKPDGTDARQLTGSP